MTEQERYEALKDRKLENIPVTTEISESITEKIPEITSWEDLNKYFGQDKRNLIRKLATEFGTIGKEYFNKDIQLSFGFSGNNFEESYSKQRRNFSAFAKMLSVFDAVIENAVGVEVHNRTNYKTDPTLDNVFVLMSAYQDGDSIVPVKLEVKKFKDKKNTLYVAISLQKIKMTEVSGQGNTENGVTQNSRSVNISISKIFEKINPSDKSFLKYIPDGFLNDVQKTAKQEAIDEDGRKSAPKTRSTPKLSERQREVAELDKYARENIEDYDSLNEPSKRAIRALLRQGRANGVSEDFLLSCGRISARSGLNVVFSKELCFVAADGSYADGATDLARGRIVINPEPKSRTLESALIHERSQ